MEPGFLANWRSVKRCIAQRNLLLRSRTFDSDQISAWDAEFSQCGESVDLSRRKYISLFEPIFNEVYSELAPSVSDRVSLLYSRGWDDSKRLHDVLFHNQSVDFKYNATQAGPHRAELLLKVGRDKVTEVLSRGQLKVLVIAMKLAQARLLNDLSNQLCTFLVDDLSAELDSSNRNAVLALLASMGGQVFFTAVEKSDIHACLPDSASPAMFHVERGIIKA